MRELEMKLQTRLELFTVIAIVITAIIFTIVFALNKSQSTDQLKSSISNKQSIIADLTVQDAVGEMEKNVFSFTRDKKLLKAINERDLSGIAARANTTSNLLQATGVVSNIRLLTSSGEILFTRNENESGSYASKLASDAVSKMELIRGVEKVGNASPEAHFMFAIAPRGKVMAVVDMSLDIQKVVERSAKSSGNHLVLMNSTGEVVFATNEQAGKATKSLDIDLTETDLVDVTLNDSTYTVVGQPIYDAYQKPVAYLVSFTDATALKSAEAMSMNVGILLVVIWIIIGYFVVRWIIGSALKPLNEMRDAVQNVKNTGDLSSRMHVNTSDEIGQSIQAMNEFMGIVENSIKDVNTVLHDVAKGSFEKRVEGHYIGAFNELKNNANESVDSLEHSTSELLKVIDGLAAGDLNVRMGEKVGDRLRLPVNSTMESMQAIMTDVGRVMMAMEKGDFSQQVTVHAKGEFETLGQRINARVLQTGEALGDISSVISGLADGDFTRQVSGSYEGKFGEVSQLLTRSTANLSQLISETRQGVLSLTDNVNQIHHGSQDLNDRTQRQAASLEETTATMQSITQGVAQTSDNARSANQLALSARTQADQGAEIMRSTIESMVNIKEASHKIEEIISLIDSIAFQTNLLALNAAVEAARAGEHGRGFAVVAGEVRNLAGKSADAARDIKGLIENAVVAVDQGTERAEQSDQALQGIIESIRKVGDIVAEITAAANEQSTSINQIGHAVSEIDQVTQQNAALVEETSAAAETMRDEASTLTNRVSKFKV